MKTATAEYVTKARRAHHDALESLARALNPKNQLRGLVIWRKLRRIEGEANRQAVAYCNGEIDSDQWDTTKDEIRDKVARVFGGNLPKGFFVNGDPRGYSLKLEENSVAFHLHEDWGRYQILAPEIN